MQNINFLKDRLIQLQKKAKKNFALKTWSLVILTVYGILIFGALSYYLVAKQKNEVLKTEIIQEEALINSLRPIEAKQIYLISKTKSLTAIFSSQRKHKKIIETILSLLPNGVSVDGLAIDSGGLVDFSGSCKSFKILQEFFNSLETEAENSTFFKVKKAQIGGVSYGWQKEYGFSVQLAFFLGEE